MNSLNAGCAEGNAIICTSDQGGIDVLKSFLSKDRASSTAANVDEKEALYTEVYALLDISTNDSNKISFKDHRSSFFYIPPISDVYTFFGFITNPKQLIDLLEKDYGYLLDISRTNKYALFDKGVSLKTARKVID